MKRGDVIMAGTSVKTVEVLCHQVATVVGVGQIWHTQGGRFVMLRWTVEGTEWSYVEVEPRALVAVYCETLGRENVRINNLAFTECD